MSFDAERIAIEKRTQDNYTTYPVRYENVRFEEPSKAPWVSLSILNGRGQRVSIGTSRALHRHAGVIQFDVYTPEGEGTVVARQIADELSTLFNEVQFSAGSSGTITTRVPAIRSLGVTAGWYRLVVSVAYQRDLFS